MHQCGGSNAVYTDRMNGTRYSWQAIILVFACWCPILSTRYAYPQTDPPQHINGVQTILSGEIELPRLVDLCAQRLNLNIEYDVNALRGTVTLRLGRGVTDAELWTLTNRLLVTRGFVSVRGPGESLLSIVKLNEAPSKARLELDSDDRLPVPAGFASVVVQAQHQPVQDLVEAIKPLLSQGGGKATPIAGSSLILISDVQARINEIMELIARIDVDRDLPEILTIPAEYLSATQLASEVTAAVVSRNTLVSKPMSGKLSPTGSDSEMILIAAPHEVELWQELINRFDTQQAIVTQSYSPRVFTVAEVSRLIEELARDPSPRGAGDQWRVVSDDLTGTIIVTATPSEHEQIAALIERLDATPTGSRRGMRTFTIRNRSVNEISSILQELVDTGFLASGEDENDESPRETSGVPTRPTSLADMSRLRNRPGTSDPPRSGTFPRGPTVDQPQRDVLITSDEGTNTLIVWGDSRLLEQIEQLIVVLDVRQAQVMLEVMIVSLSDSDTFDLGIELQKLEISGNTIFQLSSLFGLSGLDLGAAQPSTGGTGFTGVALSPGDFSVVLRALQSLNTGRSLSRPRQLVNNNEQSTLDSVLQQPFSTISTDNSVSSTTTFGGTQDAGTQVTVTPQIAEGDHVVLDYSVSLSSFVGESADPALPPPRQQNSLQSKVTIPDGYTVVLGGLELVTDADAVSQVPGLGDLPLFGELFKSRSKSWTRSRFYVFITANVMRRESFEDLKYVSDQALRDAALDDQWPAVEPRVIR
jgi:general secretion pathway protein D